MQGVLSMVAGQAVAGSLVLGSPSVATAQFCNGSTNGVVAVARKPFSATLDIASSSPKDSVIVGRVKDRVDIVIPVATVSGVHARLEKRNGQLLVTDLDSTNGTFVNDKRIRPGAVTTVPPGSYITFGDEHLAVFKFLQLEVPGEAPAEAPAEVVPEESQEQEAQAQ